MSRHTLEPRHQAASAVNDRFDVDSQYAAKSGVGRGLIRAGDKSSTGVLAQRLKLLNRSQKEKFPYVIWDGELEFEVHREVLSPKYFESSRIFARIFPYQSGDTFLDVGSGTGIMMLHALRHGAERALGVDVSNAAVHNTLANIQRHGFSSHAPAVVSDLYNAIPDKRFRTLFWNVPWVYSPAESSPRGVFSRAICDAGYRTLKRFVAESWSCLAPEGRILIGLGDFHNSAQLASILKEEQVHLSVVASESGRDGTYNIFQLQRSVPVEGPQSP